MKGICALCLQNKELQKSHIVPKFVKDYIVKTGNGRLRRNADPGKPIQDIEKHKMLCQECEELFSVSEKYFKEAIFDPYHKDKKIFKYNKKLFYFLTSLAWRSLYVDLADYEYNGCMREDALKVMKSAEKRMRDFLIGNNHYLRKVKHYVFFGSQIMAESIIDTKSNNIDINRMISSYSARNGNTIYTISNMAGIIVISLYMMDTKKNWPQKCIVNGNGILRDEKQKIAPIVIEEMQCWIDETTKAHNNLDISEQKRNAKRLAKLNQDLKNYTEYRMKKIDKR